MITVYTITYNEELLMQFMIDHYRSRFPNCHIVVYDNSSTDNTVAIAQANNCEIRSYNSNNSLDDGIHMNIKNSAWKSAKTDWVLICDLDELFDINADELINEESLGTTIFKAEAWSMVNLQNDYNFKNIKNGIRDGGYDKCVLFNKNFISDINYGAGCHDCRPIGRVQFSSKSYVMHHFRDINPDLSVAKAKLTAQRLSQANIRNNWGHQCRRPEKEIREDFERLRQEARIQTVPPRR